MALIDSTEFQVVHLHGKPFMICALKLKSGFIVTSKPMTCVDPNDFEEKIGQAITRDDAIEKLWEMEAYHRFATPKLSALAVPTATPSI